MKRFFKTKINFYMILSDIYIYIYVYNIYIYNNNHHNYYNK